MDESRTYGEESLQSPTIDVASVSDVDNEDRPGCVVNLVDDAIVANSNSPTVSPNQLSATAWPGLILESQDRSPDPFIVVRRQSRKFLLRPPENED